MIHVRPPIHSLVLIVLASACHGADPEPTLPPEPMIEPVDPIPPGFSTLTPRLTVPSVEPALRFYEEAFGATTLSTLPALDGRVMHAEIRIHDSIVMLDEPSDDEGHASAAALGGTPATFVLYVQDADADYAKAVDAGAFATLPVDERFWGDRYGELADPYGHRWALATHVEDLTVEQLEQRAEIATKSSRRRRRARAPRWRSIEGTPAEQPIPDPEHRLTIALTVPDVEATMTFYETAFGALRHDVTLGRADGTLLRGALRIGDSRLMLGDEYLPLGRESVSALGGSPLELHMYVPDVDDAFARAIDAGGSNTRPLGDSARGDRDGVVVDVAGFAWRVATHVEDRLATR